MQSRIIDPKELLNSSPLLRRINLNHCVDCKAVKSLCGFSPCPLLQALNVYPSQTQLNSDIISQNTVIGSSPQVFVGSMNYPLLNSGPMTSIVQDTHTRSISGDPSKWINLDIKDIIALRFNMVRGMKQIAARQTSMTESLYDKLSEISMSVKPVDVESHYSKRIQFDTKFDILTQPMGPSAELKELEITSNPKIPRIVDRVVGDELSASNQLVELYTRNYDVYYLQNLMAAGTLGFKKNKKLVPTRWSITATDDSIGKDIIPQLRSHQSVNDIQAFHGGVLGNIFTIILIPGEWSFENFETWSPGGIFTLKNPNWSSSKCEESGYKGRTSYASQAGGYYASRLAVLEYLAKYKKKASVVSIREITPSYAVPLGVWVVREAAREAMRSQPIKFAGRRELFDWLKTKVYHSVDYYVNSTRLFTQTKLEDFF